MSLQIKEEVVSDEELLSEDGNCHEGRVEILEYEQKVMVDTMDEDVLFISARGLGLERLFLNHLILYSDQKLLFLVLNTTCHDETYFISQLIAENVPCQPKIINADVSTKDRESVYLEGGVQFITSRILLVDLLTERIPINNVAGILVYRAHQVLSSFQESFILRLYRERKRGGVVKAFSDVPTAVSAFGQLQRLVDRLYVKRVRLIPRFDVDVKTTLNKTPPAISELIVDVPPRLRRIHSTLAELLKVCIRELKQCSTIGKQTMQEEDTVNLAVYGITQLERQLLEKKSFLSEKQSRLIFDLSLLRELLQIAEDMDPATLLNRINVLRKDKEMFEQSGGWLMSKSASSLFSDIELLCGSKDDANTKFTAPPKWEVLASVLGEIKSILLQESEVPSAGPSVLLLVNNDSVSRQIADLIKSGPKMLSWLVCKQLYDSPEPEPLRTPLWDPDYVIPFARAQQSEPRKELVSDLQKNQLATARATKKRRKAAEDLRTSKNGTKQTRIVQFGILQYKRKKQDLQNSASSNLETKQEPADNGYEENKVRTIGGYEKVPLVIMPYGERYNILRKLNQMKPTVIILFNTDIVTLRQIEIYKAYHSELFLHIFSLMYRESTEESRYLTALKNETDAFEALVREQAVLLIPREYETNRDDPPHLHLSSRDGGGQAEKREERPKIIVDMREFNSELPTVLYKKGYDAVAATLEIGDYVLSPSIAVERKALDDLTQSLQSGRVFKQIEQMLRHYPNSILLIESNRKFETKIVNGGPFQGELTRHCRDIRTLLCSLLRSNPELKLIWSLSPTNSAEYFSEVKLNCSDPDVDKAISLRSDDMPENESETSTGNKTTKLNGVILRNLSQHLPGMSRANVETMMRGRKIACLKELLSKPSSQLYGAIGEYAERINVLCTFDFSSQ